MKQWLILVLGLALAGVNFGCAGYRLGSMLPPDIKTVYVPTIVNKSSEPQVESDITQALIQDIQRDGSLRVVSEDQADTVLVVTLRNYTLEPVAYRTDQRTSAREYRIVLNASMLMTRRGSGAVVVESPSVRGEFVFPVAGDLSSSKLRGLPPAAEDLAHNIVEKMVEVW